MLKLKAFTLIELLVVIAIIGIISGLIAVAMSGAIDAANNVKIKADVDHLGKALAMYGVSNGGTYPIEIELCEIGINCATLDAALIPAYFPSAPVISVPGKSYTYISNISGSTFIVSNVLADNSIYTYTPATNDSNITCPLVGGDWINTGLGFCVMKYEARDVSGGAMSTSTGSPWVRINQADAIAACNALGAHLINNTEWLLLARSIEKNATNWSSGIVGNGFLARGWSASAGYGDPWSNTAVAPFSDASCLYNTAADTCGGTGTHLYRRTHTLANGQAIWDLSGNVYEWIDSFCNSGTGIGYWQATPIWGEWSNVNLLDYERIVAGPAGNYTSTNAVGKYFGCSEVDNSRVFFRGGGWDGSRYGGIYAMSQTEITSTPSYLGFRCVK